MEDTFDPRSTKDESLNRGDRTSKKPKIKRNFMTYITNSWLDKFLYKGYKAPLQEDDLLRFEDDMTVHAGTNVFAEFWQDYYNSVKFNLPKPLLSEFMNRILKWQLFVFNLM